ncbi:hypothetical protein QPL79_04205 [Ignisphaera sp. 4213-co]|uniref:Uncharacterized protein n=1 Tax=Ignisphaera cupida TaxID=3050454 RepID=A0ABD4Z5H0_9CREN|nr:hypothetical protein [Ignisphaera sp. 4213-co]MDK6028556.1 hypothetical protein [Ignisphaera sp. 4213-co]
MGKVLNKKFSAPFPVIGIPIKGFYTPFISMPSNIDCVLMLKIGKEKKGVKFTNLEPLEKSIDILSYINMLLSELGYDEISGSIEVSCNSTLPSISIFAVTTIEIIKNLLDVTPRDYLLVLRNIAPFDEKVLGVDPGYIESLRCSHLFNSICIVKGFNEIVRLKSMKISIEKSEEVACNIKSCKALEHPYDNYTLSLFYKFVSHVIGVFAQIVNSGSDEDRQKLEKLFKLYLAWESRIVKDYLNNEISYDKICESKSVMDYSFIRFFKIHFAF